MSDTPTTRLRPTRTALFNFATLRGPQLIKEQTKKAFYIFHPDSDRSLFLTKLTGSTSLDEIRMVLKNNIEDFEPWVRKKQIENFARGMSDFSTWLMENQDSVTLEQAETALTDIEDDIKEEESERGISLLPSGKIERIPIEERLVIWDNLLYTVLVPGQVYVRQACTQLLIADNFFRKIRNPKMREKGLKLISTPKTRDPQTDEEIIQQYILRIANSKVVIPKFWSSERNERVVDFSEQKSVPSTEVELQSKLSELSSKNYTIRRNSLYELENNLTEKNLRLDRIKKNLQKKARQKKINALLSKQPKDELELDEKITDLFLEKATSTKLNFLDRRFTKGKLAPDLEVLIDEQKLRKKSVSNVIQLLNRIETEELSLIKKRKNKFYGRSFSYHKIPIEYYPQKPGSFAFNFFFPRMAKDKGEIYLLLHKEKSGQMLTEFDFTLSFVNQPKTYRGTYEKDIEILSSDDDFIFLRLFKKVTFAKNELTAYSFHGQFKLTNMQLSPDGSMAKKAIHNNYSIHFASQSVKQMTSGCFINNLLLGKEVSVYGVNKVGIIDYRRVEQEVCCYIPGEISHIENVMAREYKERSTRNFSGTENRTEDTAEVQLENLSDSTTTNRNEMQAEVSSVLNRENSSNTGFNVGTSISTGPASPVDVTFDMGFDMQFANSNSQSTTNGTSLSQAQEITEKTLQKVIRKVASKRTSIIRREFEEKVRHGLDNRKGENNFSGVYRWIDKIYTNTLVNYGKRLTYEFMIPEPALLHKAVIAQKVLDGTIIDGTLNEVETVVKPPDQLYNPITDAASLNNKKVFEAYQIYSQFDASITEIKPFDELPSKIHRVKVTSPITGPFKWTTEWEHENHTPKLTVPTGYQCSQIEVVGTFLGKRGIEQNRRRFEIISEQGQKHKQPVPFLMKIVVPFGVAVAVAKEYEIKDSGNNPVFTYTSPIKSIDQNEPSTTLGAGQVTMALKGLGVKTFELEYLMSLDPVKTLSDWQSNAYSQVQEMYNRALAAYNLLQSAQSEEEYVSPAAAAEAKKEEAIINPAFNREIEKRELKRIAIEMLLTPFNKNISPSSDPDKALIEVDVCPNSETGFAVPHVNQTAYLEEYTSQVKFFEQAYDWSLISYVFYPYYWTDQCSWQDLLLTKDGDHLFQAFLQSGMARLLVPVRPGFEDAVKFYMSSGEIWHGKNLVVDSEDDLYISIAEELQTTEGDIEKTWETTVPTTLTAIQSSTVSLTAEGLPCCEKEESMLYDFNVGDKLAPFIEGIKAEPES